jgi:hypothetical protein
LRSVRHRHSLAGAQPFVQPGEAFLPELTIRLQPVGGILERRAAQPRRPLLGGAAAFDQARAFEDPKVLRDRL